MKDFKLRLHPFFDGFWKSYYRFADYPEMVNVWGGGPFFEYYYWEDYCPKKHKDVKIQGHN